MEHILCSKKWQELKEKYLEPAASQHFLEDCSLYIRVNKLPVSHKVKTHAHNYGHISMVSEGHPLIEGIRYNPGQFVWIEAHKEHSIEADQDNVTVTCIHHTEEADLENLDNTMRKLME